MMISPQNWQKEWKVLISMLIHFINFKDVYEQKHHEISVELEKAARALTDGS